MEGFAAGVGGAQGSSLELPHAAGHRNVMAGGLPYDEVGVS